MKYFSVLTFIVVFLSGQNLFAIETIALSGIDPLAFGSIAPGAGSQNVNDDLCVNRGGTSRNYEVTAVGDGTAGAFVLTNGSNEIALTINWNKNLGTNGNKTLSPNLAHSSTVPNNNKDCASGPNANIEAILSAQEIDQAIAGTYSGNIFITVATV